MTRHELQTTELCKLCEHRFLAPGGWTQDKDGFTCSEHVLNPSDCKEYFLTQFEPKRGVSLDKIRKLVSESAMVTIERHEKEKAQDNIFD